MDVVKSDPSLITVKPEPLVYRCRKCRYVFCSNDGNVITSVEGYSFLNIMN
jgi:hypothetical protein